MAKTLFIAGTDTNVGKTLITAALGAYFTEQGLKIAACKPFESGEPLCADSRFLKEMIPLAQEIENDINLYAFKEPLAPGVAADRAGIEIDLERVRLHIESLQKTCDVLLIEGAGGLFVPVAAKANGYVLLIDFISQLKLPVLLIGRAGIGTLNHCLLSVEACHARNIPIAAIILNQTTADGGLAENTNPAILQKSVDIPILGPFSYLANLSRHALLKEAERLLKQKAIL